MRNLLKKSIAALVLTVSLSANAGVGLAAGSLVNLANGDVLASAIGGGLGAGSISWGINRIQNGRVGWGVFFLILEEKDIITEGDKDLLMGADAATQEAFIAIISNDELSSDEKYALLSELEF